LLLRKELSSPKWKPQVLGMSGVTDCYQPIERRLRLTRGCLEVLAEFRNPVSVITKNQLVTRDIDLLTELARYNAAQVYVSVTSLDPELRKVLEPRTSPPVARLAAVRALAEANIPVGIIIGPVIPALNDHEIPAILAAATEAGARYAGYEMLRLPYGVAPLFEAWLERHYPLQKEKVLSQIRSVRGGKLNDARFGYRMRGEGLLADQIARVFEVSARRAGIAQEAPELSTAAFRRPPDGAQLDLGL
jgi:DNA repair photolyase